MTLGVGRARTAGFTLAELLVATTLLTIVFVGVYTAFSTSIRLWRLGEANLMVYQDARTSLSMLTQELESVLPSTTHLMKGTADSIEFYAIVPPMDIEEGEGARPMWVHYRLKDAGLGEGDILVREERVVESPLPAESTTKEDVDALDIKTGRKHTFELASGVKAFKLAYYTIPESKEQERGEAGGPNKGAAPVLKDEFEKGSAPPEGIKVTLKLLDPNSDEGETEFTTCMTFRQPTYAPLSSAQEQEKAN